MRLLLVEDDAKLSAVLARALREESYAVDIAQDGQEAEFLAFENTYDVIILDLMLPVQDGWTVLSKLREHGSKAPVLALTARDATEDIVRTLDSGADDYLKKPFRLDELLARVRALLRRPVVEVHAALDLGDLRIEPAKRAVFLGASPVELTAKEYALLEFLARRAGNVVSRTEISEHVWDMNFDPSSNIVDVYIGYLRQKVERRLGRALIRTVRGHGYMVEPLTQRETPC